MAEKAGKPGLRQVWRALGDRRILIVLAMGFSSGLPLALSGATLSYWLSRSGVSKTDIGLFALVSIAYSVKFLWAPVFDQVVAPVISRLGRRRSWALWTQVGLAGSLVFTGYTDPAIDPWMTALGAVLIAFFSASQDIVIDAYRVEILDDEQQGLGAAATQYGYRIGLLAAGAGALYLSTVLPWAGVYGVMAALVGIGALTVWLSPEPKAPLEIAATTAAERLRRAVIDPFVDFASKPGWAVILAFVVLFKLGDAIAGRMANPFYNEMGFTANEIATVSKIFGLIATIVGIFIGGLLVSRFGVMRVLLVGGIAQMASNAMFAAQAVIGHDVGFLAGTIFIENIAGGIGDAAFVAYLSGLCSREYTATHYALLSALASVGRTVLSASGGWMAERLGWVDFFLASCVTALPGLILLVFILRRPGLAPVKPMPAE